MDDRIRREGAGKPTDADSNSPHETKIKQWDYSENINSGSESDKINPTAKISKRFEVHIPESEDFPAYKDTPTRVPAPQNRTSAVPAQSVRPSSAIPGQPIARSQYSGKAPVRPASPSDMKPSAVNGRTPVSAKPQSGAAPSPAKSAPAKAQGKPQVSKSEPAKSEKKVKYNGDRAYNIAKGTLIACMCFIFIATLTTVACSIAFGFINDILVIDDENKSYSVVVEVPEGATYETIFDILNDNGLISQPLLTDFFCKFRHYDLYTVYDEETGEPKIDPATGKEVKAPVEYLPGVYYLYADSGIENILDSMLAYNNVNKGTVRLTFPEGWTIAEVFEKLEKYEVCEAQKLYANLEIVADQYDFISNMADSEGRFLKAEGYLFPDTYDFFIGESASSVLKKLLSNFEVKWEKEYNERLKELGMSMNEVITLASIIQCEAKDGSQMADISGVIHNRLEDSATYPTLGMDSTTDYINSLKSFNVLTDVHYALYIESYNTYAKTGLPPGPICNPGISAIRAALYPSEHDYYFFCHSDDGAVYYASNYAEHQENVQKVVYGSVGGF